MEILQIDSLSKLMAKDAEISAAAGKRALLALLSNIFVSLKDGNNVVMQGFGTFYVKENPPGEYFNVHTKTTMRHPASKKVKFKPKPSLAQSVNNQ